MKHLIFLETVNFLKEKQELLLKMSQSGKMQRKWMMSGKVLNLPGF